LTTPNLKHESGFSKELNSIGTFCYIPRVKPALEFFTLVTIEFLLEFNYDMLFAAATKEVIKRGAMYTVLGGLLSALSTPLSVLGATDLIDSRWAIAIDRCTFPSAHTRFT